MTDSGTENKHRKIFQKNVNDFADGNCSKSHSEAIDGKTEHFPLMV